MPVDFSAVEEALATRDRVAPGQVAKGKGTYAVFNNDAIKLAVEVVKQIFPDYTKGNVKIAMGSPSSRGATADYSLGEHSIRLNPDVMEGAVSPSTSQFFPDKEDGTPDSKNKVTRINFTSEEVLTNVNTILHELYHAKTKGGWATRKDRTDAEKLFEITDEIKQAVNEIASGTGGRLPSMNNKQLAVEEFMASAATLLDMRDRAAIPEKGRLREKLSTVEKIMTQFPQMEKFVESSRQPDIPSLKSGAPDPGTLGALVESIFGPPGKTEKKK